ncbi:RNA polymerase sigma-70 factor (ECF subfamily) [Kribbella sp. VKM Ac-2527]|uniref:RNA polymerase sigma-70 factor (ECF subfamily) n=1 Tax=Kribbella caucasensis TaxID=2512215 RepID=A0A4R6K2F1_9ACTN|nr:siderophore-interacting protein [Kribbella sp. VKM Ac-2527]TDO43410.1 RNA polymerase sigma-70 factor (ECF subfamily) [Kribbella sp. VKM Ac-2527]
MRHDRLVRRFAAACESGDARVLESLLAADVVLVSDSGGWALAPLRPVHGSADAARIVAHLLRPGAELTVESVNGRSGLVVRRGGRAEAVLGMSVAGRRVSELWIVLNPDKLTRWHQLSPPRG